MYFYRGREGMWSWLLHRVAGVSILLFLLAHIIDTSLVSFGPKWYNHAVSLYALPLFRIGEALLAAAIFFHAINGIRIILIDFWASASDIQRQLFYVSAVVFLGVTIPTVYVMLSPVFGVGK